VPQPDRRRHAWQPVQKVRISIEIVDIEEWRHYLGANAPRLPSADDPEAPSKSYPRRTTPPAQSRPPSLRGAAV
jgi:hypothetical protein